MRKTCFEKEVKVSYFRSRESAFLQYFRSDSSFMYCHNIQGLLEELVIQIYNSTEWRLFIDSSKQSLKRVLLHNGNLYGAVPIGHLVCLLEEHEDIKRVIELLQYHKHNWIICVDLKMVCFLLGQKEETPSIPAFCACGTAELERSIGWREIGLQDLTSNLVIPTFYMSYLLTERKLYSHLCT